MEEDFVPSALVEHRITAQRIVGHNNMPTNSIASLIVGPAATALLKFLGPYLLNQVIAVLQHEEASLSPTTPAAGMPTSSIPHDPIVTFALAGHVPTLVTRSVASTITPSAFNSLLQLLGPYLLKTVIAVLQQIEATG